MIKETEDFGGGIYLKDTARGDPSLKVKWLSDETIEIIEQLKWNEFNNKSLLSFGPKFFLVHL
jgi:hypothetical protein